jgi:hypothetical protein
MLLQLMRFTVLPDIVKRSGRVLMGTWPFRDIDVSQKPSLCRRACERFIDNATSWLADFAQCGVD